MKNISSQRFENAGRKRSKDRKSRLWHGVFISLIVLAFVLGGVTDARAATTISFTGEELLGIPTDTSININIIPDSDIIYYYEYGTSSGVYSHQTAQYSAIGGEPHEITISGLSASTKYYYRMQYNYNNTGWVVRAEHSFQTQRDKGESFVFTILSDSHAMYNTEYRNAISLIIDDEPDFHIDLGDTFMTDYQSSQSQVDEAYLEQRDLDYIGGVGQSSSIFLMPGNHENEEGWNLDDSFSIALASIQARKAFYPTPVQDGVFYTGNTDPLAEIDEVKYGDDMREDYYAWEWGDVLFVVIDPFQYTMANPYGATAGEGSDDPASGDRWNWSLGDIQFAWLKNVLSTSNAKYKFVFSHHMLGGTQEYVRGGAVPAHMFEWGGYESDGVTWGFDTRRSGWGDVTIHQMFIDYGVSGYFHGHDHQYAYEVRDDIVYLSMPRPSTGLDFNYYKTSDPYTEVVMASPGYLRVSVTPEIATLEYVSSSSLSGNVNHDFTIEPNEVEEPGILGDVTGEGTVNTMDALIILSGAGALDVTEFCPLLCGDVDGNGNVNTMDALAILSYVALMDVPYDIGLPGCPASVNPVPGCSVEP